MEENMNVNAGGNTASVILKKGAIATVCVLIVAIIITFAAGGFNKSYKSQIKDWAKAVNNDEVDEFVEKDVNLRALYAFIEVVTSNMFYSMDDEELVAKFEEYYDEADEDKYENDTFKAYVVTAFELGDEVEINKIGKLSSYSSTDGDSVTMSIFKSADIEMEIDGEEYDGVAYFYKGKLMLIDVEQ